MSQPWQCECGMECPAASAYCVACARRRPGSNSLLEELEALRELAREVRRRVDFGHAAGVWGDSAIHEKLEAAERLAPASGYGRPTR